MVYFRLEFVLLGGGFGVAVVLLLPFENVKPPVVGLGFVVELVFANVKPPVGFGFVVELV